MILLYCRTNKQPDAWNANTTDGPAIEARPKCTLFQWDNLHCQLESLARSLVFQIRLNPANRRGALVERAYRALCEVLRQRVLPECVSLLLMIFFPCASSLPSFNPTLFPRGTSGGWEVLFSCVTESTKPVATVQSFPTYVLRHREAGWKHAGGPLLPR